MPKQPLQVHSAVYEPIADLSTWRPVPTRSLEHLDPFLFLNHHGPQEYSPNNHGLPFGPHPHRGFETLTFVLQGDITHKDSISGESVITAGGIQWMTAGRGLVHAEVSSEEFKRTGGTEEVLQLWMNLPAKLKMTDPTYIGLQREDIPVHTADDGKVSLQVISGQIGETRGPIDSLTNLLTSTLTMQAGGRFHDEAPEGSQVLLYVVRGEVVANGQALNTHELLQLSRAGSGLTVEAQSDSILLYCYGMPLDEPIVAHGPFVMNRPEEIHQAIADYQAGKLGSLVG